MTWLKLVVVGDVVHTCMKQGLNVLLRPMRLRKIKLSGFKSFVDPTTLIIPGNLVGVVGPNGCGKSNIIDAVTWVMGESSAKHLRGESLTDVIFNGSSSRQPVGQATVELIFDNSEGKAAGQYGAYNEISIKRQINREAISTYYLNGTRCRRKDIHSLFLGTGLGPRGYSIIEQGMISRLIEAKPDELRVFIEEAAGISKYRERRRETENRIRHTRENLSRLHDIQEELGKQLSHLQRQSRAAERYQQLKQEQRQLNDELLALNWRDLDNAIQTRNERVREHETRVEQGIAGLRETEADIERKRGELTAANENFNVVQSEFYQVGSDISQLEQKIQNTNERIQSLEQDIEKNRKLMAEAGKQHEHDQQQLAILAEKAGSLEPELQGSRSDSNRAYESLNQAEQAMQGWQVEWDAYKETAAGFSQQIEVDNTRLAHLEASLQEIRYRRQNLVDELDSANNVELDGRLTSLADEIASHTSNIDCFRTELDKKLNEVRQARDRVEVLTENIAELRTHQQKLQGTLASLEALQHGSSGTDQENATKWLSALGMDSVTTLVEQITVEPEWTHALESVLKQHLQSVVVDDFDKALGMLGDLSASNIGLVAGSSKSSRISQTAFPLLQDKLTSGVVLDGLLAGVYIAETLEMALEIFSQLSGSESVITRSGVWISHDWIRINQIQNAEESILLREQTINSLKAESAKTGRQLTELQDSLNVAREQLKTAEEAQHACQKQLSQAQEGFSSIQSSHTELRAKREQKAQRHKQIEDELEVLEQREEAEERERESVQTRLAKTRAHQADLSEQHQQLTARREHHQNLLIEAKNSWQSTHEHSHEIALQLESLSSRKASLEQAIKRNDIQLNNINDNLGGLEAAIAQSRTPLDEMHKVLDLQLAIRVDTENRLAATRERVQTVDASIREKEQERIAAEQKVDELRGELEKVKLEAQETKVRLQTVEEQLSANMVNVKSTLENLDTGANKNEWQEKIDNTEKRIQRLGPINLAAIDEFNQLSERKAYLDKQDADLSEAMETLENAIRKIDKETRTRFKETFDNLNSNLKQMFPVLFGGGHAYLELTGEDMLETGVAIMARPPGKKNSSIHLLSGGEKALTAVALVFAIFKLNPAPFCILDEVDAPLDDTNAQRFSDLLAEMSAEVQFLFITHNKITMEIAQQLLGVTMHEPGVSRLVSVDMEEAVKMAATA